ncbi:MAG: hypothetical protein ACWGSQ_18065 [Longimicrobiales bacterium]
MTRQNRRRTAVAAFAALLLAGIVAAGCSWSTGRGQTETTPMHGRFSRTVDIQTGVVLGDLERAKAAAAWIATQDGSGDFPTGTEAYQDRLRSRAGLIAMDQELESAALHTAEIAAVCGDCHLATGGGPRFVIGSEPNEGSTPARRMIRHLWAADRMWEGLVGPSSETWMAGIGVLNEGVEGLEGVVQSSDAPEEARRYLADLRHLAEEGGTATTQEARASIYGRLLATCYGCHRSVGVAGAG